MRARRIASLVAAVLSLTALAAQSGASSPTTAGAADLTSTDAYDGAIAWISDTQFYAKSHPQHFDAITRWIAANAEARRIGYVAHTGDIVDDYRDPQQWERASRSMAVLESAGVPYGVLAGNHDVSLASSDWTETDYTTYAQHFGAGRFASSPVYGESFRDNRQHYDLVDVGGTEVMVLYTAWKLQDADYAWAADVLTAHERTPAIIATHEYLDTNGSYSGDGQDIFDRLVRPHGNVVAVLAGHRHGAWTSVKRLDGGRQVVEMLADYQALPEGGLGYIRLLHIDTDGGRLAVDTYSPVTDDVTWFDDGADTLETAFDLTLLH